MSKPFISVIIVCYDRKQFIVRAISSALNQTLDKSKYEILVVKSFKDENIDRFIRNHDIINIFNSNKKEGFRIYNAMKIAKGEVIAFLDDDDEFAKNKLERIYKYFKDNPNLVFYHNNFYMINETGKILHHPRSVGTDEVLKFKSEKEKRYLVYNALSKLRAEENASAMVLKRSLIVNNLSILKKITVALDAFSFLIALIDSGELWVDSKPLSFYRIHSVGQVTNGPLMTFDSFCSHRKKYTEIAVRDTYVLYNIVKCTAFQDFAREKLSVTKLYYKLYNDKEQKIYLPTIRDYLYFLHRPTKSKISFALQTMSPWILRRLVLRLIYNHYLKERKVI